MIIMNKLKRTITKKVRRITNNPFRKYENIPQRARTLRDNLKELYSNGGPKPEELKVYFEISNKKVNNLKELLDLFSQNKIDPNDPVIKFVEKTLLSLINKHGFNFNVKLWKLYFNNHSLKITMLSDLLKTNDFNSQFTHFIGKMERILGNHSAIIDFKKYFESLNEFGKNLVINEIKNFLKNDNLITINSVLNLINKIKKAIGRARVEEKIDRVNYREKTIYDYVREHLETYNISENIKNVILDPNGAWLPKHLLQLARLFIKFGAKYLDLLEKNYSNPKSFFEDVVRKQTKKR